MAHGITAPLGSELEALQRLWVTEKNKMSLLSGYLSGGSLLFYRAAHPSAGAMCFATFASSLAL